MNLFKDMLKSGESLFMDVIALDYDYLPKLLPFRENDQHYLANCIKPLLFERTGKNLLIHGPPGIGKTAAARFVLRDLENQTDDVIPIYINCWKKNTSFKVIYEICEQLRLKFLATKTKEELFELLKKEINKKAAVFVFDEIDKLEEDDFLYTILEEISRKTIFLITNYRSWLNDLDERIKSRLAVELMEFKEYNAVQTAAILKERAGYAFVPGAWDDDAFNIIARKTSELKDIRLGLNLLKEAALAAENRSSRKITLEDAELTLSKIEEFAVKRSTDLEDESKVILELIKKKDGKKIGELFEIYTLEKGQLSYKSFQRKIKKLETDGFISVEKTLGGGKGNTSIIKFKKATTKKLTDFS